MTAVFLKEIQGLKREAFVLKPVYVRLDRSVAQTGEGDPVEVAFAVVGNAVREKDQVRQVAAFSSATMSIGKLRLLGQKPEPQIDSETTSTSLMAMPPVNASAIELSVGVTETGAGAPDQKRVGAEGAALKKAIGPKLSKFVQSFFSGN